MVLHDLCWDQFFADLHVDDRLFLGKVSLYIAHTDAHLGSRQHNSASHITNYITLSVADLVAAAWNSALLTLKVNQFALYAFGFLLDQVLFVDKVFGIKLGDPTQASL